jgi:hypothetical protein
MKLEVQKYLEQYSLEDLKNYFKINCVEYKNKLILKYNQIDSPMKERIVQECRGLVLSKDGFKVMSLGFIKFFNSEESLASKIDWKNARVLEKLDGTFIQLYWDWFDNKWCAGTTGMAEGEGGVNTLDTSKMTFSELFWYSISTYTNDDILNSLEKGNTYMFELMTPYNIVVKPHSKCDIRLIGTRDLKTLKEKSYQELKEISNKIKIPLVQSFKLDKISNRALKTLAASKPYTEEGFVVVDENFNRVKIKNPSYVAVHHLKDKTKAHKIMQLIKMAKQMNFYQVFQKEKKK